MNRPRHYRAQARLAWHVFRGRPLAYRVRIHGGIELVHDRTHVIDCDILLGRAATTAFEVSAKHCLVMDCTASSAPGVVPASFAPVAGNWLDPIGPVPTDPPDGES